MASYIGDVKVGSTTYPVGSTLYGTCATAAATAAKVVTLANFDTLKTGVTIHVKFTYSNTVASPTLNVNSTGAKAIMRYGTTAPSTSAATSWNAGAVVSFTYDGTYWQMNDWLVDGNTNNAVTQTATTTSANYEVLFSVTADNTTRTEGARKNSNLLFNPSTGILSATQLLLSASASSDNNAVRKTDLDNSDLASLSMKKSYTISSSSWTYSSSASLYMYSISESDLPKVYGDEKFLILPTSGADRRKICDFGVYLSQSLIASGNSSTIFAWMKPTENIIVDILGFSERLSTHTLWDNAYKYSYLLGGNNVLMAQYNVDTYASIKAAYDAGYTIHLRKQYSTNYPTTTLTCVGYNATYCYFWGMCPSTAAQPAPYRFLNVYVNTSNTWSQSISSF